jgi:hypothetical protein
MVRKAKRVSKSTTNRGEFNRAYKAYLEHSGQIYCSFCGYHRGENKTSKWYGGYKEDRVKYPNWKLVSKNRKQWMGKPVEMRVDKNNWRKKEYVTFKW